MKTNNIIEVKDIDVIYSKNLKKEKFKALDNVSITLNKGEFFGLLGPNGAGKTTFIKSVLGLQKINSGSIRLFDTEPFPGSGVFEKIAYIPENPVFPEYLTIKETIRFFLSNHGISKSEKKLNNVIERLKLTDFSDSLLRNCSKGMKQKVAVAYCILLRPELLVFDELTRGLDPMTVRDIRNILKEMNDRGTTIIMNSHVLSEVEMLCTRVGILNKGRIIALGTLDDLILQDQDYFAVEIEHDSYRPDKMKDITIKNNILKGFVNKKDLADLVKELIQKEIKLYEISIRHEDLEDLMIRLIGKDHE